MANVMVTDEDDRIHVLKGKQADTFRYYFRGHVYYRDKRNDGLIFRCKHKNRKGVECSAYFTVRSLTNFENQIPRLYGKHDETEIPDPYLILREEFDSEVLFLAQTTYDDYKILFDKVKIKPKYGPIADQLLFYSKYEKRMARARSERVIRIPNDLVEWEQMLQEYPPMKDSYRGLAIGEDDSHSLVFIHKSMLPALKECAQLFGDGTFETRISRPKSAQFFTIHLRKMDIGFPAIFVFMSHRTQECYDAMWRKIFEYAPELKDNVDTVMSDFERAQINSAKLNFPNATQSGCIFHYKQAIARYWESLGIPIEYEFILERTYAVAHLKSDDVEAGFNHVDSLITGVYDNNEVIGLKLLKFGRYLRRFWLPLKTVFTVFGHPIRSNSICEVFHLHWKKKVGKRPNPWKCLEILDQLMQSTAQDFDSVCKGYRLRASRSRDWQNIDNAIRDAERLYDNRGIGIVQFLKYIESLRKLAHARVLQQKEFANAPRVINENVEFDEADVSFIANNLEAVPGAGSNFERVIIVRRRRKNREIREGDSENEDAEDGGAPNRRRTRLESVDATPAAPRRRGRPPLRRNVEETAVVNAVSEDEDNEETVPRRRRRRVEPVRAPPTIPRRRGRPRRNVELNAQESEVEDVEVTLPNQLRTRQESIEASHAAPRRRGRPRRNAENSDI